MNLSVHLWQDVSSAVARDDMRPRDVLCLVSCCNSIGQFLSNIFTQVQNSEAGCPTRRRRLRVLRLIFTKYLVWPCVCLIKQRTVTSESSYVITNRLLRNSSALEKSFVSESAATGLIYTFLTCKHVLRSCSWPNCRCFAVCQRGHAKQ